MARPTARSRPVVIALLACGLAWGGTAGAGEPPRFLIFHVDAVAAVDLDRLIADGRLPNVALAFEGGSAHEALSLFFAATRVIYPRMHDRAELAVLGGIGFGGYDRETDTVVGDLAGFLSLVAAVPRRAATSFLHGVPYLDGLNLILYTDHGLTFTDQTVDVGAILEREVADDLIYDKYPNVYLREPSAAPALASRLTTSTSPFTAWRAAPWSATSTARSSASRSTAMASGTSQRGATRLDTTRWVTPATR